MNVHGYRVSPVNGSSILNTALPPPAREFTVKEGVGDNTKPHLKSPALTIGLFPLDRQVSGQREATL